LKPQIRRGDLCGCEYTAESLGSDARRTQIDVDSRRYLFPGWCTAPRCRSSEKSLKGGQMSIEPEARTPDYLRVLTRVMGLAIACPYSQDNPVRCQLCEVRTLPMAERIDWVRGLSSGELQEVTIGHETCLRALERAAADGDGRG
jgi:hypothetical protein